MSLKHLAYSRRFLPTAQAAEARAKKNSMMPGGPRRLGGRHHGLNPQQACGPLPCMAAQFWLVKQLSQ